MPVSCLASSSTQKTGRLTFNGLYLYVMCYIPGGRILPYLRISQEIIYTTRNKITYICNYFSFGATVSQFGLYRYHCSLENNFRMRHHNRFWIWASFTITNLNMPFWPKPHNATNFGYCLPSHVQIREPSSFLQYRYRPLPVNGGTNQTTRHS
jgi:hypothetical protein